MKIGIIGLPNAGKSTLFNALTRASAEVAPYPFTTVDPNQAVVPVPETRLDAFARVVDATETVPGTITFVDIAGLVEGAHKGEGLGNRFLAHIRETDAIVHVVRCFEDERVAHPMGRTDPVVDIEVVETELVLADLEQAEKRRERVDRQAKSGDRKANAEAEWLGRLIGELERGNPAGNVPPPEEVPDAAKELGFLTAKPVLYAANVLDEAQAEGVEATCPAVSEHAKKSEAEAVSVSAKLETELAELDDNEASVMREELGAGPSGLDRVIQGAYKLLDLITFFTGHPGSEARTWSIERGATAFEAAGKIHTDMQRGFVRAEVVNVDDLIEAGSYAAARDRGTLRLEGRDYTVRDGDVITVKFSV